MNNTCTNLRDARVPEGSVRIYWLGQAGFVFKTPAGKRIFLDPYLSDVFGNMNHIDAAMMVAEAKPRWAIPCHFWTLAEQGAGDPAGFLHACARLCPQVGARLLRPGEGLTIESPSKEDQT